MKTGINKEKAALRKTKHELEEFQKRYNREFNERLLQGVKNANYVCYAITIMNLKAEGWGKKRLERFAEGYFALAEELEDKRMTPKEVVAWAEEETGIKVKDTLDNAYLEGTEV